jgi:hypothetical protein
MNLAVALILIPEWVVRKPYSLYNLCAVTLSRATARIEGLLRYHLEAKGS